MQGDFISFQILKKYPLCKRFVYFGSIKDFTSREMEKTAENFVIYMPTMSV